MAQNPPDTGQDSTGISPEANTRQDTEWPVGAPYGHRARAVHDVDELLEKLAEQVVAQAGNEMASNSPNGSGQEPAGSPRTIWVVPARNNTWHWATASSFLSGERKPHLPIRGHSLQDVVDVATSMSKVLPVLAPLIRRGERRPPTPKRTASLLTDEELCALWLSGLLACLRTNIKQAQGNEQLRIADLHVNKASSSHPTAQKPAQDHDIVLLVDISTNTVLWQPRRSWWRLGRRPDASAMAQWMLLNAGTSELLGAGVARA